MLPPTHPPTDQAKLTFMLLTSSPICPATSPNSFHLAVWVGRRAAPELLQALFGTQTLKEIEGFAPENPMNSPVIKLVEELQQCKHGLGNLPVIIILQGFALLFDLLLSHLCMAHWRGS